MMKIDLKKYPQFRQDSLKLAEDLGIMVGELDSLMLLDLSEAAMQAEASDIVGRYL